MSLLSPAIRLANAIPFTQKLLIIIMSFLLPCGFLLIKDVSQKQTEITAYGKHIQGIQIALTLKTIMLETAKHRGNMAQYLAGDASKKTNLIAIEAEMEKAIKTLRSQLNESQLSDSFLDKFDAQWKILKANGINLDAKSSFSQHTQLVAHFSHSLGQLISHFNLQLQNVATEYYLMQISLFDIPSMQELIGQLRGKGAGALADKILLKEETIQLENIQSGLVILLSRYQASTEFLESQDNVWQHLKKNDTDFKQKLTAFISLTEKIIESPEKITVSNNDYFANGTNVINDIGSLDKLVSEHLLHTLQKKLSDAMSMRNWEIAVALLVLIFGCYLATGAVIAMNQSVKELNFTAEKLKSGDFTYSPQVASKDLIGDVSQHLTEVITQVSRLLMQIKSSATQVNQLADNLQESTQTVRTELDQQNNQTIQAASASTQMAATVREVARNCLDAKSATENARNKAMDGELKVKEAIQKINRLGSDVGIAQENISHLQDDVSSISAVLEVIRSIAEQTNLLALNAAIEAARAGEQGRGFAVVADEVRSLAKRTQDSTAEIKTVIERLQQRAGHAVTIINQSYEGAQASVVSAADAGAHLHEIVKSVELMSDYNAQIATSAEEQAATADQMSRNTQQLSDSADEILKQVFKTQTFAQELQQSADVLHQNVLKFQV